MQNLVCTGGELRTDRVRWDCARARRDSLRSRRLDFVGGFSGLEGALLDVGEGRVLLFSKVGISPFPKMDGHRNRSNARGAYPYRHGRSVLVLGGTLICKVDDGGSTVFL